MGKEDLCEQLKKKTNKLSTNYHNRAHKLHSKMIKTKNCETIIVENYILKIIIKYLYVKVKRIISNIN